MVQQNLQVTGNPKLVIWKTVYCSGWDDGVLTELDVVCDAFSDAVMSSPCGLQGTSQSVVSKQSRRVSLAS